MFKKDKEKVVKEKVKKVKKPKKVKQPKEKKKKEKKASSFDVWGRHLMENLKKNNSLYPKIREYNFYTNGNATMSGKDYITYYYTIDGYPPVLNIDFRDIIRSVIEPSVKVSFIDNFETTDIEWDSPAVRSKIRTWSTIENESEDVDAYNYRENITLMDSNARRKESLFYLSDAELRRRRKLFKFRSLLIVNGVRGESFNRTITEILSICKKMSININRIDTELGSFLTVFSPFAVEANDKILKQVGNNTIPDEMLSRLNTYDQGKVGVDGIIWGNDVKSGFPVYKKLKKRDTDAENIMITGETGSGKSFFVKFLVLEMISEPEYNGTINDIEGGEYTYLAGVVANHDPVVVLDLSEGSGCYFDPVEVRLSGDPEIDKDMFSLSQSYTISIIKTMLGETILAKEWTDIIVNSAIGKMYFDAGVDQLKMETWERSKGLELKDVYLTLRDLYEECVQLGMSEIADGEDPQITARRNKEYRATMDLIIAQLAIFFETMDKGGTRSNLFLDKVSLEEIVRAKLVINSFGLRGKDPSKVDKIQLGLAQLYASIISHLRSVFSASEGKFNFKIWEEFQRWGAIPGSELGVKTAITGGRKLGDINFILSNNIKELLEEDRFGIFGNITSFAIGSIDDSSVRAELCDRLSIPLLRGEIDKLVQKDKNRDESNHREAGSMYDKAFLVKLDKGVTTIVKVNLPEHISGSMIFKTGVDTTRREG